MDRRQALRFLTLGATAPAVAGPNIKATAGPAMFGAVMATLPKAKRAKVAKLAEMFVEKTPYNLDAWDGYPAARERLYAACQAAAARPP